MRIMSLSGWGQPADSLRLPGINATPYSYDMHEGVEPALEALADEAQKYDAIIGWSLGGQLASLAIAKKMMQPQKLILIASPFQFVQSGDLALGMSRAQFYTFRDNYAKSPRRTLDKAWELVIKDDARAGQLRGDHLHQGKAEILEQNWLVWLQQLDELSCHGLSFSHFPPTLLLHGDKDVVVRMDQSEHYTKHLPDATLHVFTGCAHAPHWHDPDGTETIIKGFLGV